MHWEVGVDTGKPCNEMALPDVDGFFGGVCVVHVWGCKLKGGIGLPDESFEATWTFIVENVHVEAESPVRKVLMKFGERSYKFTFAA